MSHITLQKLVSFNKVGTNDSSYRQTNCPSQWVAQFESQQQTNDENSWNEWLCHEGHTTNTATITFIIISTIILIIIKQTAISQAVYNNTLSVTNLWCQSLPAAAVWCVQAVQICPSNLPCLASHACTSPVSVSTSTHGYTRLFSLFASVSRWDPEI